MGEGDGDVGEDDGGVGEDRSDEDGPPEGFTLWSLSPMAWEGREPLRDWIYLSVSAFPDSTPSLFL